MYYAEIPVPCREMAPIHAALRAYFADGAKRPFLWRLVDAGRVGMLSATPPSTPSVRVSLEAGRTYAFETVVKLSKDKSKARLERRDAQLSRVPETARKSVAWHWTPRQAVEALRARMAEGGCEMAFHRFDEATELRFAKGEHKVAFKVARVTGLLKVVDPTAAEAMLLAGAPRGGKAWGCGMIALPEIMKPSVGNRIAPPRTLYASIGEAA